MSIQKPSSYQAIRNGVRTYGELVKVARPSSSRGTCCACHRWDAPTWQLSTRASICQDCCERKADETLGSIVKAERKAGSWVKRYPELKDSPAFIANLAGVSLEFVQREFAAVEAL